MTSIRVRLLAWLIGPILLFNLAAGTLAYLMAWTPARIAFDQSLGEAAATLATRLGAQRADAGPSLTAQAGQMLPVGADGPLQFAVRGPDGRTVAGNAALAPFPADGGAFDTTLGGKPARMVVREVPGGALRVGVARSVERLHEARSAMLRALALLEALFALALAGLVWFSVTNGLAPLNRLRAQLDARGGGELEPLSTELPFELQPVAGALNGLLDRVNTGARAQQAFLADVAHQLRTPLAGLRTQLEWLRGRHGADAGSARSIDLMLMSTERMIRQTNQLLSLARAEPSHFERKRLEPVDLAQLVGEAVQGFVEQAAARRIDLGFALQPAPVMGDRFLLRDLIDNLVDNALRYTPEGGTVNVVCHSEGGQGVLRIDDTGPGIEPARREAVFQRFVRLDEKTTGSGLGLAIVRDIARAHGASVTLDDSPAGGLVVTLRFPAK
ncbi:MAG TPA: sensor histidine kinase [Telluria sp.]|nr:sensor histidine kinase [Telluria sp.]